MDPHLGPSLVKAPCLSGGAVGGDSFPMRIYTANNQTNAETETAQALFNGQRMEKQKLSLQISFF